MLVLNIFYFSLKQNITDMNTDFYLQNFNLDQKISAAERSAKNRHADNERKIDELENIMTRNFTSTDEQIQSLNELIQAMKNGKIFLKLTKV